MTFMGCFLDSALLFFEGFVLFEGDVGVEFGGAFVAFGDEVEADTADVFLGTSGSQNVT